MNSLNFPSWWNIHDGRLSHVGTQQFYASHGSGRALFGDWGRLGNVGAVPENGNLKICFQFDSEVYFDSFKEPFYCCDDNNIAVDGNFTSENPHLFIADREVTLNKYHHLQNITYRGMKQRNLKKCQKYVNSVHKGESLKKLAKSIDENVPLSAVLVADQYQSLLKAEKYKEACKLDSAMYTGGCIKIMENIVNGEVYVVRSVGNNLNILRIDTYHNDGGLLREAYSFTANHSPIFEIDLMKNNDEYRLLIRRAEHLSLFSVKFTDETPSKIVVIHLGDVSEGSTVPWLCSRLNNWWHGEFITSSNDIISLFDIDNAAEIKLCWQRKSSCLSSVQDNWNELRPLLPQQYIHADRANCSLLDCRQSPFKTPRELFSASHPSLSPNEHFCHLSPLFNSHYFHLFSTFNGNLLDIRMGGRQVSQWTCPFLSPVSYSSSSSSSNSNNNNSLSIVIGCQLDATHSIFQQSLQPLCKSTSLRCQDLPGGRQPTMSLGLASFFDLEREVTTVLTLDHHGAVLGHLYRHRQHSPPQGEYMSTSVTDLPEEYSFIAQDDCDRDIMQDYDEDSSIIIEEKEYPEDLAKVEQSYRDRNKKGLYKNETVFNI